MSKWVALIGLYVVQGLPHGFFGQAMPALMREQGLDLTILGLLSLLSLPWALKFIWAPALDRYTLWNNEPRRSWILCMNFGALTLLILLASQSLQDWLAQGILPLVLLLLLLNTLMATQDIATDALAVENLASHERGLGNGIQVAGYRIGMIVAGGLLLSWFSLLGWTGALWLLAGLLLLGTLPLLRFKPNPPIPTDASLWQAWKGFFRLPEIGLWLGFLLLYKLGDAFATPMIRPMLIDSGLSLEDLAWVLGTVGFIAGLLGALLGGYWVMRLGRYQALVLFLFLQAFALCAYYGLYSPSGSLNLWHLYGAVVFEHMAGGMGTAALFTLMMDRCRKEHAASDYAVQSCLVIMSGMIAGSLSGIHAQHMGYDQHFVMAAVLCVVVVLVVRRLAQRGQLTVI